jgi:hypothetical protein
MRLIESHSGGPATERDGGAIHLFVSLAGDQLPVVGLPRPFRPYFTARAMAGASPDAAPDERVYYLQSVSWGWLRFALVAGPGMVGMAFIAHLVTGDTGRNLALALGAGIGYFCLAGAAYSIYKTGFAVLARQHARKCGTFDQRYRSLARRSVPRDSSLFGQTIVGIVTFYFVATLL